VPARAELAPGRFVLGVGVGNSAVEPVGLRSSTHAGLRAGLAALRDGPAAGGLPAVPLHIAASGPRCARRASTSAFPRSSPAWSRTCSTPGTWDAAVRVCSAWVTDADAARFAAEFCLYGPAGTIRARIADLARLGVTGVLLQHVGSYTLPHELISGLAGQLKAAAAPS
jgi:hypothetical protein